VLALVNERRAAAGLGAIVIEPRLQLAAETYAHVLTQYDWFSHTGPDGSTLVDRITATGFPFDTQLGEVLAWGVNWSPEGVVQAWIDSPPHRQQLMEPIYRRAGVACAFRHEDGGLVARCVMDFAG